MLTRLKERAGLLKTETFALYFAFQDPRTPFHAKALAAFVVAHTLSPIDLIPDFIPILGYLDDLIITPLGLALALKLIPDEVMSDARSKAESTLVENTRLGRIGTLIIISIWGIVLVGIVLFIIRLRS